MADMDWYEQALARYGAVETAAGIRSAEPAAPTADAGVDPAAPPDWAAPPPVPAVTPPTRGASRQLVSLLSAGLLLIGGGLGAYFAFSGGQSASAAVALAVSNSLNARTADLTMKITGDEGTQTVSIEGSGATNFSNNQTDMTMTINDGTQDVNEHVLFDGQTVFVNLGNNLIGRILPGKSWVSVDLGQEGAGNGTLPGGTGSGGDPTAMLRILGAQGNPVTALGTSVVNGDSVQGYAVHMTAAGVNRAIAEEHLPSWMKQAVSQVQDPNVTYDVFINGTNQLVRMSSVVHATDQGKKLVSNIEMDFSNYGVPVSITDPSADQVAPFDQFVQAASQLSSSAKV
jgi:hypothetical protein